MSSSTTRSNKVPRKRSCAGGSPPSGGGGEVVVVTKRGRDGGDEVEASLVSQVDCPVCFDISLPIYQCRNGHIICEKCWDGLQEKTCPTCRTDFVDPSRNLALEKIVKTLCHSLPCKFAVGGCPNKMTYLEKVAHQDVCDFKTFPCPLKANNCRWEGRITDIVNHLKAKKKPGHSIPVIQGEHVICNFEVDPVMVDEDVQAPDRYMALEILKCFGQTFLIAFRASWSDYRPGTSIEYSTVVQLIGAKEEAANYAYRVELEREGRRLSWEAQPLELSDNIDVVMDNGDCLTFKQKQMQLFQSEDLEVVQVNITVQKL